MRYPNIDAERVRSGLTKDELAHQLGVTRKTLYNWYINGKIPQRKLEEMAELFGGCSIDYLLESPADSGKL